MPTKEEWEAGIRSHIQEIGLPTCLYKYRSWGGKYGRCILTDPSIWFSSPADFNDPFDSKIPMRWDELPRDELRQRLLDKGREWRPELSPDEQARNVEWELANNPVLSPDPQARQTAWDKYAQMMAERYGIFSVAEKHDNILCWSHYADSHRGFCVELDAHKLLLQLQYLGLTDDETIDVCRVTYENKLPLVLPSQDEDEDSDRHWSLMTVKSCYWKYEREWRLIYIGKTNLPRYIDKSTIKRIFLGCQMSQEHRDQIQQLVSDELPGTEVWEAVRSYTEFKLDFRPL